LIQYYGWTGFDPIASLFIAILIAASVMPLIIDTGKVLLLDLSERTPSIQDAINELDHVVDIASHSSQLWLKDDASVIGSLHIQLISSGGSESELSRVDHVAEKVDNVFRTKVKGLEELTIQIDKYHVIE